MEENNHIYPIFDKMLMRKDKRRLVEAAQRDGLVYRLERLRQKVR